jgi:4'-phosphopantetheinyl transferase
VTTVEVWTIELAQPPALVERLRTLLSDDEHARAARMATAARWIVARAALRSVLAERLQVAPAAVRFTAGPHGKPELAGSALRFNHSHSGDRALVALAHGAEVGVDVERTARRSAVIERTLTAGERAALDKSDRHLQLLRVWCRKEALAKASGGGLGWTPERFDTSAPAGHVLTDLELGPGYVGAVAVAGDAAEVELREWAAAKVSVRA